VYLNGNIGLSEGTQVTTGYNAAGNVNIAGKTTGANYGVFSNAQITSTAGSVTITGTGTTNMAVYDTALITGATGINVIRHKRHSRHGGLPGGDDQHHIGQYHRHRQQHRRRQHHRYHPERSDHPERQRRQYQLHFQQTASIKLARSASLRTPATPTA